MSNYVGIVSLLFMHSFAVFLCFVTQRVSMWGGTFRDDTIIGWPRRELVSDAAVLSCHATLFLVAWWDKKCCCDGERLIGNAFQRWYVVDEKYITTTSGDPILFWVTIFYHQIAIHFVESLHWLCSQSKRRDIIFHLIEKKIPKR